MIEPMAEVSSHLKKHYSSEPEELLGYIADLTLSRRVLPGTLIYLSLFVVVVVVNSYNQIHPALVYTAGVLLLLLCLFRISLFVWYRQICLWNPRFWRVLFVIGTLGVTSVWSLTWSIAILLDGLVPVTNISIMMTIGITCAGVTTLAPNRGLVLSFLLLMFIPTPAAVLAHVGTTPEGLAIVILFGIGIPFLASVGIRLNQEFLEGKRSKALLEQRAEELAAARDSALAGDKAKSDFLARMSHEIRTPMNGVMGMAELLLNTDLNERQAHFTRSIYHSSEALLNVINDILDFSKIKAGKLTLENNTFDLHNLLEEQVEIFAEAAHRKGLELTCLLPSDLVAEVTGDKNRLRQILTNLLGNALKFTVQGEISVRVSQKICSNGRIECRFEVEDTGPGIIPNAISDIFNSFSQEDNSTTRRYQGTGLGLAICQQLCEIMEGEIGVESKVGIGSTFWFTARLEISSRDLDRESETVNGFHRIGVLDNSKNSRLVIEEMLKVFNCEQFFVDTPEEMLKLLQQGIENGKPCETVILNCGLNSVPPFDLIDKIHSTTTPSQVKLLLLSPVTTDYGREQQNRDGGYVFLRKPLRREPFYRFLNQNPEDTTHPIPLAIPAPVTPQEHAGDYAPVLLAEDNLVNQEVAIAMLELLGYPVEVAANGFEAYQMAASKQYTMALMDCQMPEMDGYQATLKIRERELENGADSLPIIAVTASAMQGDREKALEVGMNDYLSKPFTMKELQKVLQLWTSQDKEQTNPHFRVQTT
jgi:two-component system sensor histidine kinase/response regulator